MVIPHSELITRYIEEEQPNTDYVLSDKLHTDIPNNPTYDIRVVFNPLEMTQSSFSIITQLSKIIKDSGSEGDRFELDVFDIWIAQMFEQQRNNIVCNIS